MLRRPIFELARAPHRTRTRNGRERAWPAFCTGGSTVRRPRRHLPGQLLDVTIRCSRGEFRLIPDHERRSVLGFWLAKALARSTGVRLIAVCQMSNHLHLVLDDRCGEVSAFMQYFLGHAAKAINKLDHIRGNVFERRFAEIVVLDPDALARRVAYAINNPVEANLVPHHQQWTGLCRFATDRPTRETFTRLRERDYLRALEDAARTGVAPHPDQYLERADLELAPLDASLAARIERAVTARAAELCRGNLPALGIERVLAASPFDRPKISSRSAMPLCFASTSVLRAEFVRGWRAFVAAFRTASMAFHRGTLDAPFPSCSFRPSTPSEQAA